MTTAVRVKPNQLWADAESPDRRRRVQVIAVTDSHALIITVVNELGEKVLPANARRNRVRLESFNAPSSRYHLVRDVAEARSLVPQTYPGAQLVTPEASRQLQEAQRRFDAGEIGVWELFSIETSDYDAQVPLAPNVRLKRGTIVRDKDGDLWDMGNSRWSCRANVDGERIRRVGRLSHSSLVEQYGPIRVVGDKDSWMYRSIRGRERRGDLSA